MFPSGLSSLVVFEWHSWPASSWPDTYVFFDLLRLPGKLCRSHFYVVWCWREEVSRGWQLTCRGWHDTTMLSNLEDIYTLSSLFLVFDPRYHPEGHRTEHYCWDEETCQRSRHTGSISLVYDCHVMSCLPRNVRLLLSNTLDPEFRWKPLPVLIRHQISARRLIQSMIVSVEYLWVIVYYRKHTSIFYDNETVGQAGGRTYDSHLVTALKARRNVG